MLNLTIRTSFLHLFPHFSSIQSTQQSVTSNTALSLSQLQA